MKKGWSASHSIPARRYGRMRPVIHLLKCFCFTLKFKLAQFQWITLRAFLLVIRLTVHCWPSVSHAWRPQTWVFWFFLHFVFVWTVKRSFKTLWAIGGILNDDIWRSNEIEKLDWSTCHKVAFLKLLIFLLLKTRTSHSEFFDSFSNIFGC